MSLIIPIMKPILTTGQTTTLKQGLISCWELNETSGTTAYDSHGSNHLTNVVATVNQTGKIGAAYSFDGSSSQLNLANAASLAGLPSITVSAWGRLAVLDAGGNYRTLVCKLHSSWAVPYYQFHFRVRYYNAEFFVGNNSAFSGTSYNNIINQANVWYHFVGTYDGSNGAIRVYINNVVGTPNTLSGGGNIGSANTPMAIGDDTTDYVSTFRNWQGLIDQVGIWNRVLNTSEIAALYNSGSGLAYLNW